MNQTDQPQAQRRRRLPQYHHVTVTRAERITPRVVRVTFQGDDLAKLETHGVAEHIKVIFPQAGQARPVLPVWTEEGPVYDPIVERPVSRTYTPRRFRRDALELDVEFVVHGEGLGSAWAAGAKEGDNVAVTLPGGPYRLDPEARHFVLAGDESALPAISQILEALPAGSNARVFLEVEDAAEEQALVSKARVETHWLHRDGRGGPGRLLRPTVRDAALPEGTRVFVACEAGVMRDIRRHLVQERGLAREAFHTHGYWKAGVANHPDHDLGDD